MTRAHESIPSTALERRLQPRRRARELIFYGAAEHHDEVVGLTHDVSADGVSIDASSSLPERSLVQLRLQLPTGVVCGTAEVCWSTDGPLKRIGLRWVALASTDRRVLETFLASADGQAVGPLLAVNSPPTSEQARFALAVSGFAHDFNNILQTISLTASAAASLEDELARAGALALLIEECDRASRLIRSLEEYVAVSPRPAAALDVVAVVGRLDAPLEAVAGSRVELSLEMSPRPCFVLATRAEVERIVMNLVASACDASPAGACVRLSVTRVLDDVKIRVVDDGLGVSPASGARVSDPLSTTRAGRDGTAVGLAVVSDVVRALGGSARLEAAGDPGGTCFEVTLPAAPAE